MGDSTLRRHKRCHSVYCTPAGSCGSCATLAENPTQVHQDKMATKNEQEPFTRISVEEAKKKLEAGEAVMVDVREPDEYAEVHASGVRLVPVNSVMNEVQQIRDFAGDKEVLFICKSGQRSALAAEFATAAGLSDRGLYNVEGGTVAWVEAGYATGDD